MKAEGYERTMLQVNGVTVEVAAYKIGESFYCHVSNTDPGATIARAEGKTRHEAMNAALDKARQRLQ
jgi:hypothetical protein